MTKAPDAFRSIGEVSRLIGVAPHVLRYWEGQFPQLSPVKRADGRRYYRPDDVRLAAGLCQVLREDGLSIRGAKRLLSEDRGAGLRQIGAARLGVLLDPEAVQPAIAGPVVRLAVPQKKAAAVATEPASDAEAPPLPFAADPAHDDKAAKSAAPVSAPSAAKPSKAAESSQQIPLDLAQEAPRDSAACAADDSLDDSFSPETGGNQQSAPSGGDSFAAPAEITDAKAAIPAQDWLARLDRVYDKLQSRRDALPEAAAALRDALKTAR